MFMLFVAAGMGLMALAHMAPFPFLLDALARGRSPLEMPRGEEAPRVYLTYDAGPNPTATPALLDVLAREGAVATFFLLDRHLDADTAPIVARMFDEGHAVALHSHTRRLMVLSPATFAQTLQAAADRIERFTGPRPCRAFRPHGGWRSGQMYAGLALIDIGDAAEERALKITQRVATHPLDVQVLLNMARQQVGQLSGA